jgi:hypothetical protein
MDHSIILIIKKESNRALKFHIELFRHPPRTHHCQPGNHQWRP